MSEQILDPVPSLGSLYAQALGRTGLLVLSRGSGARALPDVTYRAAGLRADPAQLAAYQRLLGEPGTDELPAGYVHVLAFPLAMALMVRPDFPLRALGMVHTANRVVQHRPVRLGEELTARARATNTREHRKGTLVDLVVDVEAAGRLAWEGVSTYLAPGARVPGVELPDDGREPRDDGAGRRDDDAWSREDDGPRDGREPREHSRAGDPRSGEIAAVWSLGADTGRQYAEVSGDRNPIHTSRLGAKAFGFPRPIAHGMYTAARALAQVGRPRTGAFAWEVEFAKPVLLPGRVALELTHDDDGAVRYTGRHPRTGRPHLTGTVTPR